MHATPEGTSRYFLRIKTDATPRPSRPLGSTGLRVAPFGFGTYRTSNKNPTHGQALSKALLSGCNLVDTSANYMDGQSETLIGELLHSLFEQNHLNRDEVIVVSKGGYVQGQNLALAQERIRKDRAFPEMVEFSADCWHCIHPEFLTHQIDQSLSRLQLDTIDFYLLHNPEYFLKSGGSFSEYYQRIKIAFLALTEECKKGKIQYFGVSSNTFVDPKESEEFTSLETLLQIATDLGCQKYFQLIQFPLNLLEPGAALERNQVLNSGEGRTLLELARQNGLATLINRPLNAFTSSGRLLRLVDPKIPPPSDSDETEQKLKEALTQLMQIESRFESEHLIPIQQVAWGHILQKNFSQIANLPHWLDLLHSQILPSLEVIKTKLSPDSALAPWLDEYLFRTEECFREVTSYFSHEQSKQMLRIHGLLNQIEATFGHKPTATSQPLTQRVLQLYAALDGLSCILVGMRRPEYVKDILESKSPSSQLTGDQARQCLENFNQDFET